jgi:hypothetical protein
VHNIFFELSGFIVRVYCARGISFHIGLTFTMVHK